MFLVPVSRRHSDLGRLFDDTVERFFNADAQRNEASARRWTCQGRRRRVDPEAGQEAGHAVRATPGPLSAEGRWAERRGAT